MYLSAGPYERRFYDIVSEVCLCVCSFVCSCVFLQIVIVQPYFCVTAL